MNSEENDITTTGAPNFTEEPTVEPQAVPPVDEIDNLEEDIIRNDTIPETPNETPGSIGAFAVGAFDTSKD